MYTYPYPYRITYIGIYSLYNIVTYSKKEKKKKEKTVHLYIPSCSYRMLRNNLQTFSLSFVLNHYPENWFTYCFMLCGTPIMLCYQCNSMPTTFNLISGRIYYVQSKSIFGALSLIYMATSAIMSPICN